MARSLKAGQELGAEGTKNEYDAKARKTIINECVSGVLAIKKARKDLNEEMGDIRQRLRDAGIQTAAFDFAVRLKEMEQEARDNYLDGLQECYEAMALGGQINFVAVAEKTGNAAAAGGSSDKETTHEAGRQAGLAGKPQTDNPHMKKTAPHKVWNEGWIKGQQEVIGQMRKAKAGKKADAEQPATVQ